jgi:hypothetical protein
MWQMGQLKDTNLVKVSDLMTASHQWNVPLIRSLFFAPDVDAILSIPLRQTTGEDWLGIYFVRSAYRALLGKAQEEERVSNEEVPTSSQNDSETWKRLWKLPVVPKVRVFWWRVLRGIYQIMGLFHDDI